MRGCSAMPGSQERPCIPFRKYRNKFCFQRNRNPMRKSAKPAGKKTTSSSNDRALREHLVYLLKGGGAHVHFMDAVEGFPEAKRGAFIDRKSTRLNSSHQIISYAVFCLKKK